MKPKRHVLASTRALIAALQTQVLGYVSRRRETGVEVLATGSEARACLRADIGRSLRQLARLLGRPPLEVKVLVQYRLSEQTDVRSTTERLLTAEGPVVLIRLAMATERKELTPDEILAALSDEYVALLKSGEGRNDTRSERAGLKVINRPADPLAAVGSSRQEP